MRAWKEYPRQAVAFIQRHAGTYDGRIQGMLLTYQGDTCTDNLLAAAKAAADNLGVSMQMHAAQSLYELHEMLRRTGKTTIQHFAEIGFLTSWCAADCDRPPVHRPAGRRGPAPAGGA